MSVTTPTVITELLARVPLFSCFTAQELEALAAQLVPVSYNKGDIVCTEGEEGNTFFVIASGELEVWGGGARQQVINRLGPGEVVGEMSLITGSRRAATVTAARAATLLALSKPHFDRFFLRNAKALEYFSKILCQRLATLARGEAVTKATTIISVTGTPGLKGKTLVAATLAGLLKDFSKREVLLVGFRSGGDGSRTARLPLSGVAEASSERIREQLKTRKSDATSITLRIEPNDPARVVSANLNALVAKVGDRFPLMVLDLGAECEALLRAGEDMADTVVKVVEHFDPGTARLDGSRTRSFHVVNLYNKSSRPVPINHCEPFVIPEDSKLRNLDGASQARYLRHNPRALAAPSLHRLARKILGVSVGIALGGGAAFGVAHLGVFKVLEDNGIPIDLVAGCSMGSIVGIGYAAGIRAAEMIAIANRIGTKWTTLSALDISLTAPGFLTGNRLIKIFGPLAGPIQTFDQLQIPCRTVATDIETGERVLIGSGRLDAAFRASCSVPMIWSPVKHDGRVLVDGGVVDPVPAEVVNDMGADVCIAVNAVPPLKKGVDTILSRLSKLIKKADPFAYLSGNQGLPNMFDIIMNSIQTLQYELGNFKAIAADVRINMDLADFTWIEFYRAKELIKRGAEATERALPDIKRILAERLVRPPQ
jgi:NTE family protein